MYQRINGSDWRNIWLMGDLHGCFALLMNRLRQLACADCALIPGPIC